jgi:RNA polymerase sigma-70 factor (ECF subfamily)
MNNAAEEMYLLSQDEKHSKSYASDKKQNWLSGEELSLCLEGCVLNDRLSQKKIYLSFYDYAMAICIRYAKNRDDAEEVLNDGFLKIFKELHRYKPAYADTISSFKGWLRTIMVHTAIDNYRKNSKLRLTDDLESKEYLVSTGDEDALDKMSYDEILNSVQKLTPGYRIIFNLFVVEGLTHEEIGARLGISIGASKSNLARGRRQLQKILFQENQMPGFDKINKNKSSLELKIV